MSSSNVETCRAAHRAFNSRNFDELVSLMAEEMVYRDRARGLTFRGKDEYKQFANGWVQAFSDAEVAEPSYIDAGDTVVAQFTGRGTNDGAFGHLAATGKPATFSFCEIIRFDGNGRVREIDAYYDQLGLLAQLGHFAMPQQGAAAD